MVWETVGGKVVAAGGITDTKLKEFPNKVIGVVLSQENELQVFKPWYRVNGNLVCNSFFKFI